MASSLLALLDDITALLDDVATLTKVATKKTAGVLGDDLALNAEQVTGVRVDRELPVVWAVAKGSAINKAILVPSGLLISAVAPWAITPLLMVGGAFLCFEGFEKVAHKLLHSKEEDDARRAQRVKAVADPAVDPVALEKQKIKGAIRTDFILSAEIIVISLGAISEAELVTRIVSLSVIALVMTIGVYGLVAAIVRLDDAGLAMTRRGGGAAAIGRAILAGAPWLMRGLSIAGTVAMFLVGGGILAHGIPGLSTWLHHVETSATFPGASFLVPNLANGIVGLVAGAVLVGLFTGVKKLLPKKDAAG